MKAFPQNEATMHIDLPLETQQGMDLRDYFAAKAMQSFINICYKELDVDKDKAGIVESAYELADEMLKERNKNANY